MKLSTTQMVIGGGLLLLLLNSNSSRKATQRETDAAVRLVDDPQIQAFLNNNPPPPDIKSLRGKQWRVALTQLAQVVAPALIGTQLPEGTPQVLQQLWTGVVTIAEKGFTKENVLNWLSENQGDLIVSGKDFVSSIFN